MSEVEPRGGSTMSATNIATPTVAARAGRWSAQHRKKAIWGWLAFALVAFMIGGALGTKTQTNAQSGVGESGRAARTVDNAFPKHQVEQVLVQSKSATASDHPSEPRLATSSAASPQFPIRSLSRAPTRPVTPDRSPVTGIL